jgi:hypothetical protein
VFSQFNSTGTLNRALALAARLREESKTQTEAIDRAFRLALGRPPDASESRLCLEHWDAMTARHRSLRLVKSRPPGEVVREAVEENTGEKFTFTEVLESVPDFLPDLQPADVDPETRGLMEVCLVLFNANEFISID